MSSQLSGAPSRVGDQLTAALREDLRTDWIPDALGASDAAWLHATRHKRPEAHQTRRLQACTPAGPRSVPLIDLGLRVALTLAVDRVAQVAETRRLTAGVFGYRDLATPYETEFARHQQALRTLVSVPGGFVVKTDVRDFFGSVKLSTIVEAPWCTEALAELLAEVQALTEIVLLPGHRWARRLANLVLAPVDAVVSVPFVRWQDDYCVLTRDATHAEAIIGRLAATLDEIGLSLNPAKTRAVTAEQADVWTDDVKEMDALEVLEFGLETGNRRLVRYALPRLDTLFAGRGMVSRIAELSRQDPSLLPRAAWYFDQVLPDAAAIDAVMTLLACEDDWTLGRLLPLGVRHPRLAHSMGEELRSRALGHELPEIEELGARLGLDDTGDLTMPTERMAAWYRRGQRTACDLPTVSTSL